MPHVPAYEAVLVPLQHRHCQQHVREAAGIPVQGATVHSGVDPLQHVYRCGSRCKGAAASTWQQPTQHLVATTAADGDVCSLACNKQVVCCSNRCSV
jgi:hypothetical protein